MPSDSGDGAVWTSLAVEFDRLGVQGNATFGG